MFGIFNRIKAAKNWVVCLELSSKKRYQDGLDLLEIVNKQGLYNIETLLLKIFFLTSLEQVESVKQEFDYFFESIWNQANYSKDEKYYMAAYAAWCGNSLNEKCIKDKYLKYLAFDNYNLKNVRNALKMNFPLRVDPRFKK